MTKKTKTMAESVTHHSAFVRPHTNRDYFSAGFKAARRMRDGKPLYSAIKKAYETEIKTLHPQAGFLDTRQTQDRFFDLAEICFSIQEIGTLCREGLLHHYRMPDTKNGRLYVSEKAIKKFAATKKANA